MSEDIIDDDLGPLFVVNPKVTCTSCGGGRRARKQCGSCRGTGFELVNLTNMWAPSPGFLVCGGPSLDDYPLEKLRERGVVSIGVNNAAAYAPCSGFVFGDGREKFHHAIYLDPKCLCFVPNIQLLKDLRVKVPDGTFRMVNRSIKDCPGVFGIARSGRFYPEKFLKTWYAHWGYGGKQVGPKPHSRICSMMMGLRMLHYLGCPRVYLLGCDMGWDTAKYAWKEHNSGGQGEFAKINQMLVDLVPHFKEAAFEVYNCYEKTGCTAFPYRSWDHAYRDCKGAIPDEPLDLHGWYPKGLKHKSLDAYPDKIEMDEAVSYFQKE